MNKKTSIIIAVCAVLAIAIGVYFFSIQKGKDFIDLEKGQENICNISNTQQNLLLAYVNGEKTYIAVLEPQSNEVSGTCELPFENNETIYMSQNQSGDLFIYNDTEELFKFNGSHFVKIPTTMYSGNKDVHFTSEDSNASIALQAGSVKIDKKFKYTKDYILKNAYVYSNLKDMNTLNLYDVSDPETELSNSFITVRIKAGDSIYYAIYDADTRELLRCIANPFETTEGSFQATIEDDSYLLFAGSQTYDINANEIIEHDAATIDDTMTIVEYGAYDEENTNQAVKIKASNGETYTYIMQSNYAIEYATVTMK